VRATATMTIATAVEVGQLLWHAASTAGALTVGATFDGWDFVAYIAGTAFALAWDRATRSHVRRNRSQPETSGPLAPTAPA
jgi:hypothetical protein